MALLEKLLITIFVENIVKSEKIVILQRLVKWVVVSACEMGCESVNP